MGVATWFDTFCKNLRMEDDIVSKIKTRYKSITKRINLDYYGINSEIANTLYVGSYGRGTDILVSDIDILVKLPYSTYDQFDNYFGNGQSALLQELKTVIQKTYSTSHVRGDGQVVVVKFSDGVVCEILPAFLNTDNISYTYPDTHNGGSWKTTNPKAEINEINRAHIAWNKNLKRLCRMARAWKLKWDVPIGGLLLDTLAYNFMETWSYRDKSYLFYDYMSRDFFEYLKDQRSDQEYWLAPGSNQRANKQGNFTKEAKQCYTLALQAIADETKHSNLAKSTWRKIYGTTFPD
jgi:predicted nucleotidyltransferase